MSNLLLLPLPPQTQSTDRRFITGSRQLASLVSTQPIRERKEEDNEQKKEPSPNVNANAGAKQKQKIKYPMVKQQKASNKRMMNQVFELLEHVIKNYKKWRAEEIRQQTIDSESSQSSLSSSSLSRNLLYCSTVFVEKQRSFKLPYATHGQAFHFCSNDDDATNVATRGIKKTIAIINKYTKHHAWKDLMEDIIDSLTNIWRNSKSSVDEDDAPHLWCLLEEWEVYKALVKKFNTRRSKHEIKQQYDTIHRLARLNEEDPEETRTKYRRYKPEDDEPMSELLSSVDLYIQQRLRLGDLQSNEFFQKVPLTLFTVPLSAQDKFFAFRTSRLGVVQECRPVHALPHLGLVASSPTFDLIRDVFMSEHPQEDQQQQVRLLDKKWLVSVRQAISHGISKAKTYLFHELSIIHCRLDGFYVRLIQHMEKAKAKYDREWQDLIQFLETDDLGLDQEDDEPDELKAKEEEDSFETWTMAHLRLNQIKSQPKKEELKLSLTHCRYVDMAMNIVHADNLEWTSCVDQLQALIYAYGNCIDDSYCAESDNIDNELKELQHIMKSHKEKLYLSSKRSRASWQEWSSKIWAKWFAERKIFNTREKFQTLSRELTQSFQRICKSKKFCLHEIFTTVTPPQQTNKRKRKRSLSNDNDVPSSPSSSSEEDEVQEIKQETIITTTPLLFEDDYWEPQFREEHLADLNKFIEFWNEISSRFARVAVKLKEREMSLIPDELAFMYQACSAMNNRIEKADGSKLELSTFVRTVCFITGWMIGMSGILVKIN